MTAVDTEPRPARPRRRARTVRRVLLVLVLLTAVLGASGLYYVSSRAGGWDASKKARVVVHEGDSGSDIARALEEAKVVRSAFVFRLLARMRGVATDFKPGVYDLREGLGVSAAIEALRRGVPLKTFTFTIPEGKVLAEVARIVERNTPIKARDFLAAARKAAPEVEILPDGSRNLEGLLFPKTYEIAEKTTADQLVALLLRQFERETAAFDFRDRARANGLTPYQAVVLASLIEREAKVDEDRPLVASVIYNRLALPMRLQIDATVQYEIFRRTGKYKYPLTYADLEIDSPYNTYRIDGLPPAPIAAPGAAALKAAVNPAKTKYIYYLTTDGQRHRFFTNAADFNRAVRNR